jgi:drug/metabolite transporter superfamily protein YnfA
MPQKATPTITPIITTIVMPTTTSTTMPTTTSTTIHMTTPTTTHHGYAYNFYGGLYMLKSVTRTWGALVIHQK